MSIVKRYDCLIIFIISLLVCSSFIGFYPIYILDESKNSEAAREMLVSSNFLSPFFNGQLRTDKPPLHYFFMVLGYKLFGVNAFGARFFSGVFGALTILITYWHVKRFQNRGVALVAAVILISSLFLVQEFHLAVPDPYLIFFLSFSLFTFFNFYKTQRLLLLLAAYALIGFGALTKGPIAIILPGLTIFVFLLLKKEFKFTTILKLRPLLGLFIILVITVPWYYSVHIETSGEWTKGFFLDHNISRFSSQKEGHGGWFFVTPLYVVLGLLPFSVFGIQAFVDTWKARKENDFIFFSLVISVVIILFFSVSSTKLPNYPMPCYPFVTILLANYLYRVYSGKDKSKSMVWSFLFLSVVSIALPIAGYIALGMEKQLYGKRFLSFFLLLITITGILGFVFYRKEKLKPAFFSIALGWVLTGFALFGVIYPSLTKESPASVAIQELRPNWDIIVFKRFDSAFPINYKRTFPVFDSLENIETYLEQHPYTYILTNTRSEEDLKKLEHFKLVLERKALFENHVTRVYTQ